MIVGTAGHIDHGKTTLVRALTGVDTDRLPEEKARGITIDLGYAYRPGPNGEPIGFVDVPGHERLVHNMLAGAGGVDFALLVVAADDGPMPQTREHLQILDLLGIRDGVVAITKIDLVPPARRREVEAEVKALLAGTTLQDALVLPVSAVTGEGVEDLWSYLAELSADATARDVNRRFRLAVDRAFSIAGAGTVVTGTVMAGSVRPGDRLFIAPGKLEARVRGIHAQGRPAEEGHVGQRCAVNLAGISREQVKRGDWLIEPSLHGPTDRLDIELRLLKSEPRALRHWTPVHLHIGAAHATARVALLEMQALEPGQSGLAQLVLDEPVAALAQDKVILRDSSASRTIGGGRVLDPVPPRRGRRRPERIALLAALAEPDDAAAYAGALAALGGVVDLAWFERIRNVPPDVSLAEVKVANFGFAPAAWTELAEVVAAALAAHHAEKPESPGLDENRLRLALPRRWAKPVFHAAVVELVRAKRIAQEGGFLRLPGHAVRMLPAEEKLWERVQPHLAANRFHPPRVRELAELLDVEDSAVRQMLRRAAKLGRVVQIAPDHFFLRATAAEMAHLVAELSQGGEATVTAASFRDRLGTGRKVAIQVLEFFDRAGITARIGDERRVVPAKVGHFGPPPQV